MVLIRQAKKLSLGFIGIILIVIVTLVLVDFRRDVHISFSISPGYYDDIQVLKVLGGV